MELRKANLNDLDNLVENRIEFINSIAKIDNIDEFKIHTRRYLQKQ